MSVKMRSAALAAVVISGFAASKSLVASTCSNTVIAYQASGAFGPNVIQGPNRFKLAGEPFTFNLYACESDTPALTGSDYSGYSSIELWGTVGSFTIKPTAVLFVLVQPPAGNDLLEAEGVVTIAGQPVSIHASVALPPGTLTSTSIAPFPEVHIVSSGSGFLISLLLWHSSTAYAGGEQILDSSQNAQEVITAGTSGATPPVWNDQVGGTTTDGTVVWRCLGPQQPTELSLVGINSHPYTYPSAVGSIYMGSGVQQ